MNPSQPTPPNPRQARACTTPGAVHLPTRRERSSGARRARFRPEALCDDALYDNLDSDSATHQRATLSTDHDAQQRQDVPAARLDGATEPRTVEQLP